MQLTKQQKIVAAVLALAVAAFITDRWVIGHEVGDAVTAADAAALRPAARPASPAVAAAPAAESAYGNVAGLAQRLENLRMTGAARGQPLNLEAVRDAFRPPAALVDSRKAESVDELADAARRFVDKHKLAAVIRRQSGRGVAIIEDKSSASGSLTVVVGQSLDGFTLVAVKDRVAILRRGPQRVELRLQDDANPGTITPSDKIAAFDTDK